MDRIQILSARKYQMNLYTSVYYVLQSQSCFSTFPSSSEQNGPAADSSSPLLLDATIFSCTVPRALVFFSFLLPLSCAASSPTAFIMRRRLQALATRAAAVAAAVRPTALAAAAAAAAGIARSSSSSALRAGRRPTAY